MPGSCLFSDGRHWLTNAPSVERQTTVGEFAEAATEATRHSYHQRKREQHPSVRASFLERYEAYARMLRIVNVAYIRGTQHSQSRSQRLATAITGVTRPSGAMYSTPTNTGHVVASAQPYTRRTRHSQQETSTPLPIHPRAMLHLSPATRTHRVRSRHVVSHLQNGVKEGGGRCDAHRHRQRGRSCTLLPTRLLRRAPNARAVTGRHDASNARDLIETTSSASVHERTRDPKPREMRGETARPERVAGQQQQRAGTGAERAKQAPPARFVWFYACPPRVTRLPNRAPGSVTHARGDLRHPSPPAPSP